MNIFWLLPVIILAIIIVAAYIAEDGSIGIAVGLFALIIGLGTVDLINCCPHIRFFSCELGQPIFYKDKLFLIWYNIVVKC